MTQRSETKLEIKLPSTKEELLKIVGVMNYSERIETISRLGRDNAQNAAGINKLITELEKREDLANPSVAAEEDFTDLLPSQEKNVEKHFSEEQLSIFLASSVGNSMLPFIQKNLESSSQLMKKKVIREFVRLETSDQRVFQFASTAVPKVKSGIVKASLRQNRKELVDLFFEDEKRAKPSSRPLFLHGCTPRRVDEELKADSKYLNTPSTGANLAKFHPEIVIRTIENELKQCKIMDRTAMWGGFTHATKFQFFSTAELKFKLLQLALKYPRVLMKNGVADDGNQEIRLNTHHYLLLPSFIVPSLSYYIENHPKEIYEYWTRIYQRENVSELRLSHNLKYFCDLLDEVCKNMDETNEEYLLQILMQYKPLQRTTENWNRYLKRLENLWSKRDLSVNNRQSSLVSTYNSIMHLNGKRSYRLIFDSFCRIFREKFLKGEFNQDHVTALNTLSVRPESLPRYWKDIIKPLAEKTSNDSFVNYQFQSLWANSILYKFKLPIDSEETSPNLVEELKKIHQEVFDYICGRIEQSGGRLPLNSFNACGIFLNQYLKLFELIKVERYVEENEGLTDLTPSLVVLFQFFLDKFKSPVENQDLHGNFDSKAAYDSVEDTLIRLFSSPKMTPKQKETLYFLRDVTRDSEWKAMTKEAASAHRSERGINITRLVQATQRTKDSKKYSELLTFVWGRIKNEVEETREEIFKLLFTFIPQDYEFSFSNSDIRQVSLGIIREYMATKTTTLSDQLKDSLKNNNADLFTLFSSESLSSVVSWTREILASTCKKELDEGERRERFNYAAELQWELFQFKTGKKLALNHFVFSLDSTAISKYLNETTRFDPKIIQFVDSILEFYSNRLEKEIFDSSRKSVHLYKLIVSAYSVSWYKIPAINQFITKLVQETKNSLEKDEEGNLILEADDPLLVFYNSASNYARSLLFVDSFYQIADTLLHSYQCSNVFGSLLDHHCNYREEKYVERKEGEKIVDPSYLKLITQREKSEAKDRFVERLLKVSSSAIRLRYVWSHLVSTRQDLLAPFVGAKKTFYGVFNSIPPRQKKKKSSKRKTSAPKDMKSPKTAQQVVEEQRQNQREVDQFLSENPKAKDHGDFFIIPATYGLRRVFQSVSFKLAQELRSRILNLDISVDERNKAAKRWTLNPTTNYPDIVSFLNDHVENCSSETDFPVILVRSLYRGLLLGDDPIAPIHFLLSPSTLAKKDYSQVSVYSISKSIPLTHTSTFVGMIKLLLEEKRRKEMTTSVHKQIVRMIACRNTLESFNLIEKEIERKDLHRDVRIAAVKSVSEYLRNEELKERAFQVILKSSKRQNADELMLLLSASLDVQQVPSISRYGNLFLTPQLHEQWDELRSVLKIPLEFCERYAREVILPISNVTRIKQEDKLEDLKLLATFAMYDWANYLDHNEIAERMVKLLNRKSEEELKPYLNDLPTFEAQFNFASNVLVNLCHPKHNNSASTFEGKAKKEYLYLVMKSLCENLETSMKTNFKCSLFSGLVNKFFNLTFNNWWDYKSSSCNLTFEEDEKLLEPLKRLGIYAERILKREFDRTQIVPDADREKRILMSVLSYWSENPSLDNHTQFLPSCSSVAFGYLVEVELDEVKRRYFDYALIRNICYRNEGSSDSWFKTLMERLVTYTKYFTVYPHNFFYSSLNSGSKIDIFLEHIQKKPGVTLFEEAVVDFVTNYYMASEGQFVSSLKYLCQCISSIEKAEKINGLIDRILTHYRLSSYPQTRWTFLNGILSGDWKTEAVGPITAFFLLSNVGKVYSRSAHMMLEDTRSFVGWAIESLVFSSIIGRRPNATSSNDLYEAISRALTLIDINRKDETAKIAWEILKGASPDKWPFATLSSFASDEEIQRIRENNAEFKNMCASLSLVILQRCGGSREVLTGSTTEIVDPSFQSLRTALLEHPNPIVRQKAFDIVAFSK
eukprot:TRINITY_DN1957_c0_g2_i1.p1 TRINITY_DN1957_c0_g2~~TRINITY_DN1957_c0_g2_i1.p1  ORF type:complete len:1926 (-),score=697.56 TRINITY_DN1957_c0_g2_i1:39-5816(-)